ncbi:MAG: FKBP-type peptidyl-prolyl cis-trans isomerase [Synoicihabitans sp.]
MKSPARFLSSIVLSSSLLLGLVACQKAEPAKEMPEPTPAPEPAPAPAAEPAATSSVSLETLDQKVSYGIGRNIANDIRNDPNFDVDADALVAGMRDTLASAEPKLSEEEIRTAFGEIRQRAEAASRAKIAEEQAKAVAYLEANKARDGVMVTDTGLQYEILTAGEGPKPQPTDRVKVHYHGTLIDGTVFDSSVQRGTPAEFGVTQVIAGWVEGLQLMPVGSKWKLHIPPALGYGDRGQGSIPGGAALVFEVELLEIVTPAAAE